MKLTEEGILGPHNVDLFISDEAHWSLSERRSDNLDAYAKIRTNREISEEELEAIEAEERARLEEAEAVFDTYQAPDNHVVRLAFTASAEYDLEKTVEKKFNRLIFKKDIIQALNEGELADYIRVQFFMRRLYHEDAFKAGASEARKKQEDESWREMVVEILKQSRDEVTGLPLYANQGAIFVSNTKQANSLAAQLNNDPFFQKIAKERGYKAFATPIHTVDISRSEQEAREEDYLNGKYCMIIGDDKFKEGFDHPPMKTIIDTDHGSLVDKLQIIGRGARKDGDKGLTFIDTLSYWGSDDPEVDEQRKMAALRNAVTAIDILKGVAFFSPKFERGNGNRKTLGQNDLPAPTFTLEGVDVYSNLEAAEIFKKLVEEASQFEERSDLIIIQNWMINNKISGLALLKMIEENNPNEDLKKMGITLGVLNHIKIGDVQTIKRNIYDLIIPIINQEIKIKKEDYISYKYYKMLKEAPDVGPTLFYETLKFFISENYLNNKGITLDLIKRISYNQSMELVPEVYEILDLNSKVILNEAKSESTEILTPLFRAINKNPDQVMKYIKERTNTEIFKNLGLESKTVARNILLGKTALPKYKLDFMKSKLEEVLTDLKNKSNPKKDSLKIFQNLDISSKIVVEILQKQEGAKADKITKGLIDSLKKQKKPTLLDPLASLVDKHIELIENNSRVSYEDLRQELKEKGVGHKFLHKKLEEVYDKEDIKEYTPNFLKGIIYQELAKIEKYKKDFISQFIKNDYNKNETYSSLPHKDPKKPKLKALIPFVSLLGYLFPAKTKAAITIALGIIGSPKEAPKNMTPLPIVINQITIDRPANDLSDAIIWKQTENSLAAKQQKTKAL